MLKWINKFHEFDSLAKKYHDEGFHFKRLFIFGAGKIGKEFYNKIESLCKIEGFIDNDKNKQGTLYCGCPVISLQHFIEEDIENSLIIICLKNEYSISVKRQLKDLSIAGNIKYIDKEDYLWKLRISLFYEKGKIYIPLAQISLTERCTLKCKKCAHACNYVLASSNDLTIEEAKCSADCFFKYVDFIEEFVLIGGEPFLYKNLDEIIQYIGDNYRGRIRIFSITTNGTILPSDRIFMLCRKYDVMIRASNYSETLPWITSKLNNLKKKAEDFDVTCEISSPFKWNDFGFEYVNRGWDEKELEHVFDECRTPCHEVRKNRFYFCVMARSVSENMNMGVGKEDFLDISIEETQTKKKEFFEYAMGYSKKGYLDMCNYCHGADKDNYPVIAAEQMPGII